MATTPPDEPRTTTTTTTPAGARSGGYGMFPGTTDFARLPIPGNAEFAVWALVSLLILLIVWIDGTMSVDDFILPFTALTAFYLLSRGIAKASRVLEQ